MKLSDTVNGITVKTETEGHLTKKRVVIKFFQGDKKIEQMTLWRVARDKIETGLFSEELHKRVIRLLEKDTPLNNIYEMVEWSNSKVNKYWHNLYSLLKNLRSD